MRAGFLAWIAQHGLASARLILFATCAVACGPTQVRTTIPPPPAPTRHFLVEYTVTGGEVLTYVRTVLADDGTVSLLAHGQTTHASPSQVREVLELVLEMKAHGQLWQPITTRPPEATGGCVGCRDVTIHVTLDGEEYLVNFAASDPRDPSTGSYPNQRATRLEVILASFRPSFPPPAPSPATPGRPIVEFTSSGGILGGVRKEVLYEDGSVSDSSPAAPHATAAELDEVRALLTAMRDSGQLTTSNPPPAEPRGCTDCTRDELRVTLDGTSYFVDLTVPDEKKPKVRSQILAAFGGWANERAERLLNLLDAIRNRSAVRK
jgi:hypothetical protein